MTPARPAPGPGRAPANGLLSRLAVLHAGEAPAVLLSFTCFACLLCGYYLLRPIREEMGIARGVDQLPVLFTGTFVAMSLASPAFSALAARWPRRRLVPATNHFFAANLVGFYLLWRYGVGRTWVPFAFYVWAAVYNLFVTSVFWSLMTDLFSVEQGKRLFGLIAAGGSLGALAGPALTGSLVTVVGGPNLLLLAAFLLEAATACVIALARWARAHPRPDEVDGAPERAIGGTVWSGVRPVLASPYLLGSALYIFLLTVGNTFLYFQQAHLVAAASVSREVRTQLFARIDLVVNVCTVLLQALVTGRVLRRLGIATGLAVAPTVTAIGFTVLAVAPSVGVLGGFQGIRRAAQYAILRPSRELLFSVVTREERYKSKNFIDTVVFRGGDMLTGWLYAGLSGIGLGVTGTSWIGVPVAIVWLWLGVALGRAQRARAGRSAPGASAAGAGVAR